MTRKGESIYCETCNRRAGEPCVRVSQSWSKGAPPLKRSHPARILAETFLDTMAPLPGRKPDRTTQVQAYLAAAEAATQAGDNDAADRHMRKAVDLAGGTS